MYTIESIIITILAMGALLLYIVGMIWLQTRLINPITLQSATTTKKWKLALIMGAAYAAIAALFAPIVTVVFVAVYSLKAGGIEEGTGLALLFVSLFSFVLATPIFLGAALAERAVMWRIQRYYALWQEWGESPGEPDLSWWSAQPEKRRRWYIRRWAALWRVAWPLACPGKPNPFNRE